MTGGVLVGGFVSQCWYGVIKDCYSKGNVIAEQDGAGFIARHEGGKISKCYSLGNVTTTGYIGNEENRRGRAGGFVSHHDGGDIENCYCKGDVRGTSLPSIGNQSRAQVGGFVGLKGSSGYMKNCYCIGAVSGIATLKGGFAGEVLDYPGIPLPEACYYYMPPNNQIGIQVSEQEMKEKSTFSGWDFSSIWAISQSVNEGFPYFGKMNKGLYVKFNNELKGASGYVKKNGELLPVSFVRG
ncbi:hypothetical protein J2Z35_002515 [Acetoanaerobium pronyense]|uniref:GLUG domain-containing protein n=1 Tax=Acetoanaerobium pronyense TaxID=1482736 RepID=A0ABS4KLP7_9FIRM|nr:GLUG motif-containing protein [Acetoanaerobium pronyense]MBP2028685.1 hypothetical protein [Acetoanaerobium pronyense]